MRKIRLLFMDVDGTLTDGKIYMGAQGEALKAFDIKDGYGIHEMLPEYGIVPVIITGRTSKIVENRAAELGVTELYQGRHEKLETMREILERFHCPPEEAADIGDDFLDLPCMRLCGVCGCPADAVPAVRDVSHFVSTKVGGSGAVREFIEWLAAPENHGGKE